MAVLILGLGLAAEATAGEWFDKVKVKGDLRYRHEMIDQADADARHRHRLRARLGVYGQVNDFTKVGVQMATGSDDPVSTNQTLDNSFSTKDLRLDLAFFQMTHDRLPGLTLTGGKFKNPFYKPGSSELIWDSDWNPEGGALNYSRTMDKATITLIGAGLWIDERSSGDDSWLGAVEGVLSYDLDDATSFKVGGSYYNYLNSKGFEPFWDGSPMGNSVVYDTSFVPNTNPPEVDGIDVSYAGNFELLEGFVEATRHFDDLPVTAMFDYVKNTAVDSLSDGWLVGLRVGKAKEPGSWSLRYIYREVKKDAVVGTFTDSDFRGGGTDAKGHEVGGSLAVAENANFNVTYFANKIGLQGDEEDFGRLQVDLQLKF
jgi:hypothetical protein